MGKLLTLAMLLLMAGTSVAKDQREDCNRKGAGSTGSERNRIVSECIRRNASVSTMPPRLARMTECNREAGEMTGEARVRFVDTCMSKP